MGRLISRERGPVPVGPAPLRDRDDLSAEISRQIERLPGWCTVEKANETARLILDEDMQTYFEIGIFGGRSLVPAALAMKLKGSGMAIGVDPWSPADSATGTLPEKDLEWWGKVDHLQPLREFVSAVVDLDLTSHCTWFRTTSQRASGLIDAIDMLHIDGNHSPEQSMFDVETYLPKVRPGGVVIFDDVDWASTEPAWRLLDERCPRLGQIDAAVYYRVPAA